MKVGGVTATSFIPLFQGPDEKALGLNTVLK